MSLKVFDGFDHYNGSADLLARSGFLQWQFPIDDPGISFVTGLAAIGKALQLAVNYNISVPAQPTRAVFADRNAEATIGLRMNIPLGTSLYLTLYDTVADAPQVTLFFSAANYSITAYRGSSSGTLLALSANNVWTGATNQFVEIQHTIANSAGSIEVRVRDETVLSVPSADTQATVNAWADGFDILPFISGFGTATAKFDDFYYADTGTDSGGLPNNTFLGDAGTRTLFPIADGTVAFTPNFGSAHFSRVNEAAMDSDTSYNSSATPGDEDRLTFQPIVNVIVVTYGLQVTVAARKDDVGPRVLKTGLVAGGTTAYGANHSLPDTYAYFTDLWVLNPDTGMNWTRTEVNALVGIYNLVS